MTSIQGDSPAHSNDRVVIIGGGIAGLMAALVLSRAGRPVVLLEAASYLGGKINTHPATSNGQTHHIDCGPTVFTLKPLFEDMFAQVGLDFDHEIPTSPLDILARHFWAGGGDDPAVLDLPTSPQAAADAIGSFASAKDARGFTRMARDAESVFRVLDHSFMRAPGPSMARLMREQPLGGLKLLAKTPPHKSLWSLLGRYFDDPRLVQLFARYATYCGGVPMLSMSTLLLIIHVELAGVWQITGGMRQLAKRLADLASAAGADLRTDAPVTAIDTAGGGVAGVTLATAETISANSVLMAGDVSALAGLLPDAYKRLAPQPVPPAKRSLSAVTLAGNARLTGPEVAYHSVFFSPDYEAEFDSIRQGQCPSHPTVYLCASARADGTPPADEPIFTIANAVADGDQRHYTDEERSTWTQATQHSLAQAGLQVTPTTPLTVTTPQDWATRFPGSGGALYGRAPHGMLAAFQRPALKTRIPGLYLAGGSVHPSAGVPMAALSGFSSANTIIRDWTSRAPHRRAATVGGTWTSSAKRGTGA